MAGITSTSTSITPGGAQDVGFKVSKEDIDVFTAAKKDLIISSGENSIKIAKLLSGAHTTGGGGEETLNVPHVLTYLPGYTPFIKVGTRWYGATGDAGSLQWLTAVDETNLKIVTADGGSPVAFNYKAFMYVDPATNTGSTDVPGQDVGTKISQQGYDVFGAKEQNLIYLSSRDTFRIIDIKTLTVTGGGSQEATVAHGLPFTPGWFGLIQSSTSFGGLLGKIVVAPYVLLTNREIQVWSDSTNIGVKVDTIGSEDYTVKVAVLANKLE